MRNQSAMRKRWTSCCGHLASQKKRKTRKAKIITSAFWQNLKAQLPTGDGMEPKKQRELEKRNGTKPLHHIDACILTEVLLEQNRMRECVSYLNKFPNYQKAGICTLSMGEIITTLLTEPEKVNVKMKAFELLDFTIERDDIRIIVPTKDTMALVHAVQDVDSRIDTTDAINLACAIENEADVFVTFDEKLLNNERLERTFKIRIRGPSTLV